MTLRTSLLRQLENPKLSAENRAELRCELARGFEDKGEYEAAREVLAELWQRIGERPKIEGLQASTTAEVLMRVGVLAGIIGSKNQITGAQETAKNLISESLTIFESLSYKKKIAEAQTELALCYWRTGEYNEARDILKDILKRLTTDSELRAKAVLRLAIVEQETARYTQGVKALTDNALLFEKINNQTIKGSYHVTLGNLSENLWESGKRGDYLDRALVEYAAASYHFEKAEHKCYRANVENNLGFLYFKINQFKDAHAHLDKARRILTILKDTVTIAQVDETRARVFLKEQRNAEAEGVSRLAIRILEKSDRQSQLAEALITHGRALARLTNYGPALSAFRRAIDLSEHTGSIDRAAEAALAAFQEIGKHLTSDERRSLPSGRRLGEKIQVRVRLDQTCA
jgi:tetratricopeptide (TPR) repeat protein